MFGLMCSKSSRVVILIIALILGPRASVSAYPLAGSAIWQYSEQSVESNSDAQDGITTTNVTTDDLEAVGQIEPQLHGDDPVKGLMGMKHDQSFITVTESDKGLEQYRWLNTSTTSVEDSRGDQVVVVSVDTTDDEIVDVQKNTTEQSNISQATIESYSDSSYLRISQEEGTTVWFEEKDNQTTAVNMTQGELTSMFMIDTDLKVAALVTVYRYETIHSEVIKEMDDIEIDSNEILLEDEGLPAGPMVSIPRRKQIPAQASGGNEAAEWDFMAKHNTKVAGNMKALAKGNVAIMGPKVSEDGTKLVPYCSIHGVEGQISFVPMRGAQCKKYIVCIDRLTVVSTCEPGTIFDFDLETCISEANTECDVATE